MKQGGSKQKGAQYEREVCKRLSLWVSDGQRTDIFWRSAMSGGRATVMHKQSGKRSSSQAGDVSYVEETGAALLDKFMVDCKHYKDLKVEHMVFMTGKTGIVGQWRKAKEEAYQINKFPMLIAKQNHKPEIVMTDRKGFMQLAEWLKDGETMPVSSFFGSEQTRVLLFEDMVNKTKPVKR